MDYYNLYQDILEYIPLELNNNEKMLNEILYKSIYTYLYSNKINKVLISLSGGVDSMVLLEIMYKVRDHYSIDIICCHVNYNNREESVEERNFLKEYCNYKKVIFECMDFDFKRGSIKRNVYEEKTRKIRYQY